MSFTYNHLNLPTKAVKTGTSVDYLYDANGRKLRKTAVVNNTTNQRDYIDGIEYSKQGTAASAIELLQTEEGYLLNNSGTYTYHYYLTDHLGNVRATLQRATATTGSVIQKQDYYPYGKSKTILSSTINKYLYNAKELQVELDGQYDYGARFYDAEIGRWNVVDPLAEKFPNWTPYHYVHNNPINLIDSTGMVATPSDWVQREDGSIYWDKNAKSQATTKAGETYLGENLSFEFNSYIDKKLWDGPTMGGLVDPSGDKLTSKITLTGNDNSSGELTSITAKMSTKPGETPVGTARDYYPGEGGSNNVFSLKGTGTSISMNFEQHASVSPSEEFGLNRMGYEIVDVAQKLNIDYTSSTGKLSVSSYTNIFPSATLKMNGTSIMQYNQPSFKDTHTAPRKGWTRDFSYYPSVFYKR